MGCGVALQRPGGAFVGDGGAVGHRLGERLREALAVLAPGAGERDEAEAAGDAGGQGDPDRGRAQTGAAGRFGEPVTADRPFG
ncbi:hypothetical protein GCM10027614_15990 [Micromonospora vulcania]